MNIDDVTVAKETIPVGSAIWPAIFKHQHELEVKYGPIERRNGFYVADMGANLDDPQVQNYLKNLFWRVTEELAEAGEEMPVYAHSQQHWRDRWETDSVVRHFFEELADGLHFFVAASLLIGIDPEVVAIQWDTASDPEPFRPHPPSNEYEPDPTIPVMPSDEVVAIRMMKVVAGMGLAANCLKNKPWKSSHMPTDIPRLQLKMTHAWHEFIMLWKELRCSTFDVYMLYAKKNEVNKFRQRSNY